MKQQLTAHQWELIINAANTPNYHGGGDCFDKNLSGKFDEGTSVLIRNFMVWAHADWLNRDYRRKKTQNKIFSTYLQFI